MARKYDIIDRLKAKNEKPFVRIDEEHTYTINTKKTNVLAIMALSDESEDKNGADSLKMLDKIIEIALGKEASKYITSQDFTIAAISDIVTAIMAGISDEDIEEAEKRAKSGKK